jgi:hypothetical protein
MPAGCDFYLDPSRYVVFGPFAVPASGMLSFQTTFPLLPQLDNTPLYFQWGHASIVALGTSEAKAIAIRQY